MTCHVNLRAQEGCAETISANVLKSLLMISMKDFNTSPDCQSSVMQFSLILLPWMGRGITINFKFTDADVNRWVRVKSMRVKCPSVSVPPPNWEFYWALIMALRISIAPGSPQWVRRLPTYQVPFTLYNIPHLWNIFINRDQIYLKNVQSNIPLSINFIGSYNPQYFF